MVSFGEYFDNQHDRIVKAMQDKNKQLNVEWMERYEKRKAERTTMKFEILEEDYQKKIAQDIKENDIILFMKGTPYAPQCGFSAKCVDILEELDVEYETRDVLSDPELRQGIKDFSDWQTIPQLYVKGEFIGGCDIMIESFEDGTLNNLISS